MRYYLLNLAEQTFTPTIRSLFASIASMHGFNLVEFKWSFSPPGPKSVPEQPAPAIPWQAIFKSAKIRVWLFSTINFLRPGSVIHPALPASTTVVTPETIDGRCNFVLDLNYLKVLRVINRKKTSISTNKFRSEFGPLHKYCFCILSTLIVKPTKIGHTFSTFTRSNKKLQICRNNSC